MEVREGGDGLLDEFQVCCSSCGDGKESGKDSCLLLKINGASKAGGQEVNDVPAAHAFRVSKSGRVFIFSWLAFKMKHARDEA